MPVALVAEYLSMAQRQLEFWPDQDCIAERPIVSELDTACRESRNAVTQSSAYASLKRVQVVHERTIETRPVIGGNQDAIAFFAEYWAQCPGNDQERFVVACLNVKNRIQSVVEITVGTLDASLVHPREVFKVPIIEGSSSIILSHNHPSGDPTPSKEDHAITMRLEQAGELLGIEVLDHIIHGDSSGKTLSLRDVPRVVD